MRLWFSICFLCCCIQLQGQGIYTDFGQNRVQDKQVFYSLKRDNVEIIYYEGGEELARLVFDYTFEQLPEYESRLNYNISNGVRIVVFNHFIDFQNSNINLTNPQQYAGGYSTLTDNTSSVYFSGSRIDLFRQTRKAIAEILVSEFIFGGDIRDRIQTSALLVLPNWYFKGLVAYLAESWNVENDDFLKDFLLSGKANTFTSLQEEDEVLAGHSIWRYVEEKFGSGSVGNVVFITRVGRSVESAFNYYTGLTMRSMLDDWERFYKDKYRVDEATFKLPKGQENVPSKLVKKRITQFKLSPDGKQIAIVTNTKGKFQVVLYHIRTKKTVVMMRGGHQLLNQEASYDYPKLAWTNEGKNISVITFQNGVSRLSQYKTTGEKSNTTILTDVPIIKDFNYNSTGELIVMSVIRKGESDIIIYNTKNKTITDVTNDIYDDLTPRFSNDGNSILFSSNRKWPVADLTNYFSVFEINIQSGKLDLIAGLPEYFYNYYQPIELQNGYVSFLSDANGINNNYAIKRGDSKIIQLTNYKRSILYNDIAANNLNIADLLFYNNRYRIYVGELSDNLLNEEVENPKNTAYRIWLLENKLSLRKSDSSRVLNPFSKDSADKLLKEKINDSVSQPPQKVFISGFPDKDDIKNLEDPKEKLSMLSNQITKLNFGVNYFVFPQFDNSLMNNYLFPSNVNEVVFNYPLLNFLLQTKISDNLNNYQIEAGVRIPVNIKASDYFIKYTNLRGRWDKTIFGQRRGRVLDNDITLLRMVTEQIRVSIAYPFNQRTKISFTGSFRQDRMTTLATDSVDLYVPSRGNIYFGGGAEYVYDNIKSRGLNLFEGLRFKIYNDNYIGTSKKAVVINNGFDARYYLKLHRQIYFASRLSGAFSLGPQKTAYYLGGVENQIGYAKSVNNFNYSIPILNSPEFSFQTLAAPMRGFLRNTRGGSNFVLLNAELRIPILSYLIQKPITSDFFRSIMFIGFADMGTAWQGRSPYDISNPFNTKIIQNPSYSVTVISKRNPMLYSAGIGARAKILGHYIKVDHGWGYIENQFQKSGMTTVSLGLDF